MIYYFFRSICVVSMGEYVQSACNRVIYVEKAKFIYKIFTFTFIHISYVHFFAASSSSSSTIFFSPQFFSFRFRIVCKQCTADKYWSRVDDKEMIKIINKWEKEEEEPNTAFNIWKKYISKYFTCTQTTITARSLSLLIVCCCCWNRHTCVCEWESEICSIFVEYCINFHNNPSILIKILL